MPVATITCKNCSNQFEGKYCNRCGEKVYTDHDRSLSHVAEEGLHFVTHFEGTIFKTLGAIFTKPGKLSFDYCDGIRKSYFKPLSFFLLLVVVYLLFPVFEGLNQDLYYHTHSPFYGKIAMPMMEQVMIKKQMNDPQLRDLFHQKSEKVSKFLLLLLIPLNALVLWAMSVRRRPYFFDQFVLSAEINSFFLLAIFLMLPLLLTLLILLLRVFHVGVEFGDAQIGVFSALVMGVFVASAMRRFYGYRRWPSILRALGYLVGAYVMINIVYKFLLFLFTWLLVR